MGWNTFSTTPKGYGVTGGSARLAAGATSQLVKASVEGPVVWCVTLVADTSATFTIDAGCGQSAQTITQTVRGGRCYLSIVAEEVQVNATAGAATSNVSAAVAPDNGPNGSPATAVSAALTLTAATTTTIPATGRQRATIHNNTGGVLQVQVNSVDLYRMANQTTIDLVYSGAFQLRPASTGAVSVVEFFA